MANVKVSLYQSIKVGGKWTLRKAPQQRLRTLSEGGYYIRHANRMEAAGADPAVAIATLKRKQAELTFLALGGEVKSDESGAEESTHVRLADAVKEYIADCRDRRGTRRILEYMTNFRAFLGSDVESSESYHPGAVEDVWDRLRSGAKKLPSPIEGWWHRCEDAAEPYVGADGQEGHFLTEAPSEVLPYEIVTASLHKDFYRSLPGVLTGTSIALARLLRRSYRALGRRGQQRARHGDRCEGPPCRRPCRRHSQLMESVGAFLTYKPSAQ